jgi:hypothetical protein
MSTKILAPAYVLLPLGANQVTEATFIKRKDCAARWPGVSRACGNP